MRVIMERFAVGLIAGAVLVLALSSADAQFADPFGSYTDGYRQGSRDRARTRRPLTVTAEQRVVGQYLIAHALDVVACKGSEGDDAETRMIEKRYGFARGQRFHETTFAEYRQFRSQLRRGSLTCQTVRQVRQKTRGELRAFVPEVARADGAQTMVQSPQVATPQGNTAAPPLRNPPLAPGVQEVDCRQCEEGNNAGSSAITRMAYCSVAGNSGFLIIAYNGTSDREYAYLDVSQSTWNALKGAPSKGRFVNLSVKPHHRFISAAKICGRGAENFVENQLSVVCATGTRDATIGIICNVSDQLKIPRRLAFSAYTLAGAKSVADLCGYKTTSEHERQLKTLFAQREGGQTFIGISRSMSDSGPPPSYRSNPRQYCDSMREMINGGAARSIGLNSAVVKYIE